MNFPFEDKTLNDTYYIYCYHTSLPTTLLPLDTVSYPYNIESIIKKHKKLINKFNYDIVK